MIDLTRTKLELAIHRSGISEMEILRAAGMCPRHMYKVRMGKFDLTPKAEKRIRLAIGRLKKARNAEAEDATDGIPVGYSVMVQYRLALSLIEAAGGMPAAEVLAQDPSKRATADQTWLRAANARRIALFIVNQFGGVAQTDLGRAIGMTKAAVHLAVQEIAAAREQPEVKRVLDLVEGAFQG